MAKKPTSSENVITASEAATDATSVAGTTEPRSNEAEKEPEKAQQQKSPVPSEIDALKARVAELEADIAFLRSKLGWPTR